LQSSPYRWKRSHKQKKYENEVFYALGFSVFVELDFLGCVFFSIAEKTDKVMQ